ncbi:MAG: hypothetical protein V3R73_03435, partial [Sphingomonadales bacterium]
MRAVAIFAFILASIGDFVPDAGKVIAIVSSAMAVWSFPGAFWLNFSTVTYNILATAVPTPGFIINDLIGKRTPMAEEIAAAATEAGYDVEPNLWLVAIHVGCLLYGFK